MSTENVEQQIQDLQDTIELLTLDKEQLVIDKELLEEKILQLQTDNELLQKHGAGITDLQTENRHLKETNNKLKEQLGQEQEKARNIEGKILSLQQEYADYKSVTDEKITDLLQQVDSLSQFESIIEKLTNENESLKISVQEFKQTIQDLEDAAELNEELDDQQRRQIEADRKIIESYEIRSSHSEQRLIEKEVQLQDLQKKLESLKDLLQHQKQENQDLHLLLSTENEQYQNMEEKLQLVQYYKQGVEMMMQNLLQTEQQLFQQEMQHYRFQLTSIRYEQTFTQFPFMIEESKIMNVELLIPSLISMNLEIQRQLSFLYRGLQQFPSISLTITSEMREEESTSKVMTMTLQWMMFSLLVHQVLVHHLLQLLYPEDGEDDKEPQGERDGEETAAGFTKTRLDSQSLLLIKNELEQFLGDLTGICQQVLPGLAIVSTGATATAAAVVKDETGETKSSSSTAVYAMNTKEAEQYYSKLMQSYLTIGRLVESSLQSSSSSSPVTASTSSASIVTRLIDQLRAVTFPNEQGLTIETLSFFIALVLESITITTQPATTSLQEEVRDLFRSFTLEYDRLLASPLSSAIPRFGIEIKTALEQLYRICCKSFLNTTQGFFVYPITSATTSTTSIKAERDLQQSLKEMVTLLRQLSTQLQMTTESSESRGYYVSQYYPYYTTRMMIPRSSSTTTTATAGQSQQHHHLWLLPEEMRLFQGNFYQCQEKYWKCLFQDGASDLLFLLPSNKTTAPSLTITGQEPDWKRRLTFLRDQISEKLFASFHRSLSSDSGGAATPSLRVDPLTTPYKTPSKGLVSGGRWKEKEQQFQDLQQQLELKQEEVLLTRQKCLELQETLQQSMQQLEGVSQTMTQLQRQSEEAIQGQEQKRREIETLETALQTLELKLEQVMKENKQLKMGSTSHPSTATTATATNVAPVAVGTSVANSSTSSGSSSTSGGGTAREKMLARRRNPLDSSDAKAMLTALANKEPMAKSTTTASAATTISSSTTTLSPTISPSATTTAGTTSFSTSSSSRRTSLPPVETERLLLKEIQYWKGLATQRMIASLTPLPESKKVQSQEQRMIREKLGAEEEQKEEEKDNSLAVPLSERLTALIPERFSDPVSNLKQVYYQSRVKRIQAIQFQSLQGLATTTTTMRQEKGGEEKETPEEKEKELQRQLKLLQSKKYLYYHEPILFQLVSSSSPSQ